MIQEPPVEPISARHEAKSIIGIPYESAYPIPF